MRPSFIMLIEKWFLSSVPGPGREILCIWTNCKNIHYWFCLSLFFFSHMGGGTQCRKKMWAFNFSCYVSQLFRQSAIGLSLRVGPYPGRRIIQGQVGIMILLKANQTHLKGGSLDKGEMDKKIWNTQMIVSDLYEARFWELLLWVWAELVERETQHKRSHWILWLHRDKERDKDIDIHEKWKWRRQTIFLLWLKKMWCVSTLWTMLFTVSLLHWLLMLVAIRESACVTALSAYAVFRHFQSVFTFVAAIICHLSKTRRLSLSVLCPEVEMDSHTEKHKLK